MTDSDLIRRQDALAAIHAEMKRTYTPARKGGMKQALALVRRIPSVQVDTAAHSYWFDASGWWLCDNCGGRRDGWKPTPFCPHCGAKMDALEDAEIE